MGPAETMPEFEPPVFSQHRYGIATSKVVVNCNWAQILEGAIDSAHSSSLHSSDMVPARVAGASATRQDLAIVPRQTRRRVVVHRTPFGFRYTAIRRPIQNAQIARLSAHDALHRAAYCAYTVRTISTTSPSCMYRWTTRTPISISSPAAETCPVTEAWRSSFIYKQGIDVDDQYRSYRTRENNYKQDRQAMKLGDFTGVPAYEPGYRDVGDDGSHR